MGTTQIPPKATGLTRLIKAFVYSYAGLKTALKTEAAFRQEVALLSVATFVAWWLPIPVMWGFWITFAAFFLLALELLNTGLERLVDLCSPEYHPLAKEAKDIGSAVVLLAMVFYVLVWAFALWPLLTK